LSERGFGLGSIAFFLIGIAGCVYWLFLDTVFGLPVPRQVLLSLIVSAGFFLHGCRVALRRDRLVQDGRVDHGYVTKLIYHSTALATTTFAITLPTLYLLAAYAIEGATVSAPEIEARLPSGYNLNFVLGISALGGLTTMAYAVYGYFDHVNAG